MFINNDAIEKIRNDFENTTNEWLCSCLYDKGYLLETYGKNWYEAHLAIEQEMACRFQEIIKKELEGSGRMTE